MNGRICIRNEERADYEKVERLTRQAFYNQYVPGCTEHYLVRLMREHQDFIPELDYVLELDGEIVGNIMYTKSRLTDEAGNEKEILTFGPVSVAPACQRKGYGKMLMERSFQRAAELGCVAPDEIVSKADRSHLVLRASGLRESTLSI